MKLYMLEKFVLGTIQSNMRLRLGTMPKNFVLNTIQSSMDWA